MHRLRSLGIGLIVYYIGSTDHYTGLVNHNIGNVMKPSLGFVTRTSEILSIYLKEYYLKLPSFQSFFLVVSLLSSAFVIISDTGGPKVELVRTFGFITSCFMPRTNYLAA